MGNARSGYPSIGDYAIIGDCRSAALVSRHGSVQWLCWPRFDSPSLFAAMLDRKRGGEFYVRPTGEHTVRRRYLPDTNVLETTFRTSSGELRLLDLMPVASEAHKSHHLWPDHQLLRRLECTAGVVQVEVFCDPRPDYARSDPKLVSRPGLGIYYEHAGRVLVLRSDLPLEVADGGDARGKETLRAGDKRAVSLVYTEGEPAVIPPLGDEADEKIRCSCQWWREWAEHIEYQGPHRDAVMRSALVLKLMTYAPSGSVVAAPTTSLPEWIGADRNWDYRFCWLRDASMTLEVLYDLGCHAEAESFLSWLLHSTRTTHPKLQVCYDVYGRSNLGEDELDHLEGYRGSRPVRIGNDAQSQLQLDLYGEVLDAVHKFVMRGGSLDKLTGRALVKLGEQVSKCWKEPDQGIWESRAPAQHHVYSKVMCWVALDRLLDLHQRGVVEAPVEHFQAVEAEIRHAIETEGFDTQLGAYTQAFGSQTMDAALLLLAEYGYADPKGARMRKTAELVRKRLEKNGLLYRYDGDDGMTAPEGAFGVCSFWNVTYRALEGDIEGAHLAFEKVASYANDLLLFGEEIDPDSGETLGNFPQALTHVGLVACALRLESLSKRADEQERAEPAVEHRV